MKEKNLIFIIIWIGVIAWGLCSTIFKSAFMDYINISESISVNKALPWIYNPLSGFYEPKVREEAAEEDVNVIDFYSDSSFQRFLDDNHLLSENYEADDIVRINSDFTTNDSSKFYLREEAATQFADMARAFSNAFDFKAHLTIDSAWRSQAYQRKLSSNCSVWRCATPWASEHEAWLALDLWANGGNIKWCMLLCTCHSWN